MMKGFKNIFHSVSLFCTHTMYLFEFGNNRAALFHPFRLVSEAHCASRCVIYLSNRNMSLGAQFVSYQ